MKDALKKIFIFIICAVVTVISINFIRFNVEVSIPTGIDHSMPTLHIAHSGSVKEDVSITTPYGITVR